MTTVSSPPDLQTRALRQQGYEYSPEELRELRWGLRFTPTLCMIGALLGLWMQEPLIHFALGATGIIPLWFPSGHPFDRLYNHLLRPLWKGVKLPPNPFPRRVACLAGGTMNIGAGLAFFYGQPAVAYTIGFILVPLQLIVISTHFCVASWLYEVALRMAGVWGSTISADRARELVGAGARLVDVREPDEFARGQLQGAINIPVDQVEARRAELADGIAVLYCQSGMRSQRAWQILTRRHGLTQIYNLGAMDRWQS